MPRGLGPDARPHLLSIPERLGAPPDLSGDGVTIAFVDSGFHPHLDLMRPRKRILAYVDVTADAPTPESFLETPPFAWHGTMTACVAAGSGYLSGGRYRGLASAAQVVLIRCADDAGRMRGDSVAKAMRVPLEHPELGVRVVNVSVGVDADDPAARDVLATTVELVRAGITVVCAAGNREGALPEPPASAPEALTVGGWSDENSLDRGDDRRFPSSFGGGKPDLLAPAMWLPAPMLTGTLVQREAYPLFALLNVLEEQRAMEDVLGAGSARSSDEARALVEILAAVQKRIGHRKYISPDYQHVEGTSFSAPLTTSVLALMLEADPTLTPAQLKEGVTATARVVDGLPREVQGAGVLDPSAAVAWARKRRHVRR